MGPGSVQLDSKVMEIPFNPPQPTPPSQPPSRDSGVGLSFVSDPPSQGGRPGAPMRQPLLSDDSVGHVGLRPYGGTSDQEVEILPAGWRVAYAQDGRKYYIDDVHQATSWERPM